jgi:hypothetical protein
MHKDFDKAFADILGTPCWGVKPGYGASLTLEFGKPRLFIHEPIAVNRQSSAKVKKALARRRVYVHCESHLWLTYCHWVVKNNGKRIGDGSTKSGRSLAANFLDGQKLIRYSIFPGRAESLFHFDLGATLITSPHGHDAEQ